MTTVNPQDLVPSISIENLLRQRDAAMERLTAAAQLLRDAHDILVNMNIIDTGYSRYDFQRMVYGDRHQSPSDLLEAGTLADARQRMDAAAWHHLIQQSGLWSLLDATARAEWQKKIADCDIPPLTTENILATFEAMHANRGDLFERGVLECFKRLAWCYKTNRPFAFGKKIIVSYLQQDHGGFNHRTLAELNDLQRVFRIVDGKPEEDHRNGILWRLQATYDAQRQGGFRKSTGIHEDAYMAIQWFKNGNGHILFKRPELVARLNQILAKHYPAALPHDPHTKQAAA